MTIPQSGHQDAVPAVISDRSMPFCQCPANCGGLPEAHLKLESPYPAVAPGVHGKPPSEPYQPSSRGELVVDVLSGRTGVFMGRMGRAVYLRPESGGVEWEADPHWLDRPPIPRITVRSTDSRPGPGAAQAP
ncbi:hypothetical protein [Streptomyces sp. CB03911]|uniref:hypothetical protein n=1 Tax=Streptomyces sp. CB03911 TaxID=1804758 RepID=UPI00257009DA|nr:hypothetical protein [Streptomyces sp. CB03911]